MSDNNKNQQNKMKQEKADRLSQALRENLRKRKAQARGRTAAKTSESQITSNDKSE